MLIGAGYHSNLLFMDLTFEQNVFLRSMLIKQTDSPFQTTGIKYSVDVVLW